MPCASNLLLKISSDGSSAASLGTCSSHSYLRLTPPSCVQNALLWVCRGLGDLLMSLLSALKHLAWKTSCASLQASLLQAAPSERPRGAWERAALCRVLPRRRRVLASFDTLKRATAWCQQGQAGPGPSLEQERFAEVVTGLNLLNR